GAGFYRSFRELMGRLYGKDALQPLYRDHPIWLGSGKFAVSPDDFKLEGVKQGGKTIVVYSPEPLAGVLESEKPPGEQRLEKRRQQAFRLGANIIAYATGLEPPKPRLTKVDVPRDDAREEVKRGYLEVAQLHHEGDWQPAPKAMRNLMAEVRKAGLDVVLKTTEVQPSTDKLFDYDFLYMHGRKPFEMRKEELKNIRFKLETGGTLFADACCGSAAFNESFHRFTAALWEDKKLKLEPIPLSDELFSKELNGVEIRRVRCRREAPDGKKADKELQTVEPSLEGLRYNGRWVVIYSRYDIGCALEHHQSPDCLGHDYPSAVQLGRAAVLYALKR